MEDLRKYRFKFELPILNSKSEGIALFDFIGTFMMAYFLENMFNITKKLNIKSKEYYVLIMPIAIIVHYVTNTTTFLNTKLSVSTFNIYKLILIMSLIVGFM